MPLQIGQPFEERVPATASKLIALVIGNKNYRIGALRNPANDALKVAAILKRLGFEVQCRLDLNLEQMNAALEEFTKTCRYYETALIYYAGHGMQVDSTNVLFPIDIELPEKETTAGYSSAVLKATVNLADILEATRSAMRTLIFLDACREFPESRRLTQPGPEIWRSLASRGFAMLDADKERNNLVVSFAADAGKQALDGDRRNSPYTLAFSELALTRIKIDQLLGDLRHKVYEATDGRQRPREINTLVAPFSLSDGITTMEQPAFSGTPEDLIFADAATIDVVDGYRYYLTEFPDGIHAVHAQRSIARLTGAERVRIQAPIFECADPPFFTPGRGLKEWFQDAKDAPQMVIVPALSPSLVGTGRSGVTPGAAHPFAVSRTPVTFTQWMAAFAAGGVSVEPADTGWGPTDRPVTNVSWHDAQSYIAWLSRLTAKTYYLLSVTEWDYCCLGATTDGSPDMPAKGATKGDQARAILTSTRSVGLEAPNKLGLYDMFGNVWEWCADTGSSSVNRKAKGGHKSSIGVAHTEDYYAVRGEPFIGFRVARKIELITGM